MEHLYSRPLKIVHGFERHPDRSLQEDFSAITERLESLRQKGFGGIVSNVAAHQYLRGEDEWRLLAFAAKECKRMGLRFWLYDEDGYPSGAAGGLTIAENPDFEARGVVLIEKTVAPGQTFTLELPRGHMHFLAAALYPTSNGTCGGITDFSPLVRPAVYGCTDRFSVKNPSDAPAVLCAFAQKRLYEGTHAQHNVFRCRRYIDPTNPDAVKAFLQNTYNAYRTRLSAHIADDGIQTPGKIEAIFTDEPSLMGCYINAGLYPNVIQDAYDDTLPLYPVISWGRDYETAFLAEHGYSCLDELIYRFVGKTDRAKQYRADSHKTLSDLYEHAFFAQIGDFCRKCKIPFSGHLLLEDDMRYHTVFEGNFFSLLRHMDIPGIDMLFSIPEAIYRDYAFTPQLVSSIAEAYGKEHVMSEVSAHAQGGHVTERQQYTSVCLQYAFGADIFNYYYSEDAMDPDTYAAQNNALARIGSAIRGKTHRDVLLYYPIETFAMHHLGSDVQYGTYSDAENACWEGVRDLLHHLNMRQIGVAFADTELLLQATVQNGLIKLSNGVTYSSLLLPPMEVTAQIADFLSRCADAGVCVRALSHTLFQAPQATALYASAQTLVDSIDRTAFPVYTKEPIDHLALLCRETANGRVFLLVNAQNAPRSLTLSLRGIVNPVLYDPFTNNTVPAEKESLPSGAQTLHFSMDAYGVLLIRENQ